MNGIPGMDRKMGRKFSRDRAGAAELIGDILLVGMSVIMVAALALQLSTVSDPSDSVRADLVASYDGENITVLHMGGEALKNPNTRFQLFINDSYDRYANITDGKSGATWQVGENWTLGFHTNPTQRVKIQVIDTKNSQVILDQILQRGPDATMVPDLGLTRVDIVLLFNGHTFNDTNGPMADDPITVNLTVHNYGPAAAYNFTVRVSDYSALDKRSYQVLDTVQSLNGTSAMNISTPYTIPAGSWGMHTLNVRIVPLPNETRFANNYASVDYRAGYTVIASHPGNPVLRIRSIESYPAFPVHGAYVNLTSRISNQGGVPANATVCYYAESVAPGNLIGVETGVRIPVGGESVSTIVWRTTSGGVHNVIVNVTDPSGSTDQQVLQVEVLPTILLVDDDRTADGGLRDVTTSMKDALATCAASFTVHTVPGGGDGPLYDVGEHPLRDYDLVIWLTGYEPGTTLTANDITQLGRYLDENGKLWLIGQDVVSGLGRNHPFLNNYMKVSATTPLGYLNIGLTDELEGSGPMAGLNLTMNLPFPTGLTDRSDTMRTMATAAAAFNESGGGNPFAILFNATTNGTPTNLTCKTALFGFEPSQIENPYERSMMTYEMLQWFGVGADWGRDLAVSDQRFSKTTPAFMETINVTIYVRNNALTDEPLLLSRPQLQVGFYVDGIIFDPVNVTIEAYGGYTSFDPPTSEIWIPQDTGNASLMIPGRGGHIKVTMSWVADRIGQHSVIGVVDPYGYIPEINEGNNAASASLSSTVYVRYGTLVVDDDGSANNGGANYDSTSNITAALDMLGYMFDQFNTTGAGDGPTISKMELYNAIIWVTGESGNALTAPDQARLTDFLDKGDGRYLWLIGPRAVPNGDYTVAAGFYRDHLRVGRVDNPVGQRTPNMVEGTCLDPVAHGVRYPATPTYSDAAHKLVPYNDGLGMIYENPMPTTASPNEIAYSDGADGTTSGWYKRVIQLGTTSDISNVIDVHRGGGVIQLTRTGAHLQNNFFLVGDYSLTNDQNPNALPWKEDQRSIAQWSFKSDIGYTFIWHLTDTVGAKHTLTYTNSDSSSLGAEPVHHGLGAYTADGSWHTVTRDLLIDLREGAGNGGLSIREVDGFEVAINVGTVRLDDITLSRPFMAIRHDNVTNNFKTVFCAWDPSFISYTGNNVYTAELVYMVMSWFNMYDERAELRVTHLDMFHTNLTPLRDMKPMMGESYMLKARVWNPGGTRGDAVVRFTDGTTVIDSVSVSVEHDSFILAEIIWTPLFAGSRTLSVSVDPDNLLEEIFEFNNNAQIGLSVFFFYDDMENGPGKWEHESTIVRLNGESTLEYMDPGPVNSNIQGRWATYNGWNNITDNASLPNITAQYHSRSNAVYMHESKQDYRRPVDCVIVIDRSGSMAGQKLQDAKNAAMFFVTQMEDIDRISVWYYDHNVNMAQGFTFNKATIVGAIRAITSGGNTAGWTAMTQATNYCIANSRVEALRAVVFLTDGQFNADNAPYNKAFCLAAIANLNGPLFTIGLGAGVTESNLVDSAAASAGGTYSFAPTSNQLQAIYAQIAQVIEQLAQTLGRSTPELGAGQRGQVAVFTEDFENAAPAWTVVNNGGGHVQSTWTRGATIVHGGGFAYRDFRPSTGFYTDHEDDYLVSPVFDLTGATNPRLAFWSRPVMETNDDRCTVQVSNNGGTTWTQVWTTVVQSTYWQFECYLDLTAGSTVAMTANMQIRFWFDSDNNNNNFQGWTVDDIEVSRGVSSAVDPSMRYWMNGDETSRDRNITTPTFSLAGVSSAKLTFWHKYNLKVGSNGGVLMVGTAPAAIGPYTYRYLTPAQPYPNNLRITDWGTAHLKDDAGTDMRWCYNGISGAGKFTWDFVQADISAYVGNQYVRVKFMYLYCGGGTGYGWAVDDVEVRVHRSNSVAVTAAAADQWELIREGQTYGDDFADGRFAFSGQYSWWNHNPQVGIDTLKGGNDNSLITIPIDLSRAKDARLNARFRFNILYPEGRPPDGFRVEISSDLGITWRQINMGVRSAWNVSGTEAAGPDGTSYTGVNIIDNWVSSGTVTRLNCDLSGWAGSVIQIRFRVVTRNDTVNHHQDLGPGFGGFFIDDVTVTGNTTTGQGRSAPSSSDEQPSPCGPASPGTADGQDGPADTPADRPDREKAATGINERMLASRRTRPDDCWFPTE